MKEIRKIESYNFSERTEEKRKPYNMEREREGSVSRFNHCSKLPSMLHWVSSYYHLVQALSDAGTLDILIYNLPHAHSLQKEESVTEMLDLVESRNLQFEVTKRAKPSSSHAEIKKNSHTKTKRRGEMRK
jgi:hypothetical protein